MIFVDGRVVLFGVTFAGVVLAGLGLGLVELVSVAVTVLASIIIVIIILILLIAVIPIVLARVTKEYSIILNLERQPHRHFRPSPSIILNPTLDRHQPLCLDPVTDSKVGEGLGFVLVRFCLDPGCGDVKEDGLIHLDTGGAFTLVAGGEGCGGGEVAGFLVDG